MNALIAYAHPELASFNAAPKDTAVEAIRAAGHQVEVRLLWRAARRRRHACRPSASMEGARDKCDVARRYARGAARDRGASRRQCDELGLARMMNQNRTMQV
jgi:hypothetical protein